MFPSLVGTLIPNFDPRAMLISSGTIGNYLKETKEKFPHRIPLLLDIHGQSWRKDTLVRGTKDGTTLARFLKLYFFHRFLSNLFHLASVTATIA